jgi:hypothetical protein
MVGRNKVDPVRTVHGFSHMSGAESLLLEGKEGIALAVRRDSKWKSENVSGIEYESGE